ncbi:VOC family protein [Enterococcus sp. BWM-S5]|uniref:VOC family protein n=1 Tax=Enterococcus larvae TaxID=2794352 RepID=A0ABS4CRI7_9ENTE|nr:VOC family protein [Enterococcus larvae]MBP1048399.1 VOC family protein [Enterococcus larvae]
MKFRGPMLIVKDIEKSKGFYTQIIGVRVISDLGENATLTGGLALQTEQSWLTFTNCKQDFFRYGGNVVEMYFEEEDFDGFMEKLRKKKVELLGSEMIMPWGQKVARLYDPDGHIIEVGEDLKIMVKRLYKEGLTIDELADKTYMEKGMIEKIVHS